MLAKERDDISPTILAFSPAIQANAGSSDKDITQASEQPERRISMQISSFFHDKQIAFLLFLHWKEGQRWTLNLGEPYPYSHIVPKNT